MNLKRTSFTFIIFTGLTVFASTGRAQETGASPEISDIALLSQVINWTGIFRAIVIILIAWLLLRFVDRIVHDLGRSVAEHRLAFQRFNAFFHFFVYMMTVVIIVLFSFDFSPQVVALFGGCAHYLRPAVSDR